MAVLELNGAWTPAGLLEVLAVDITEELTHLTKEDTADSQWSPCL